MMGDTGETIGRALKYTYTGSSRRSAEKKRMNRQCLHIKLHSSRGSRGSDTGKTLLAVS
jgi:hypothetical protein